MSVFSYSARFFQRPLKKVSCRFLTSCALTAAALFAPLQAQAGGDLPDGLLGATNPVRLQDRSENDLFIAALRASDSRRPSPTVSPRAEPGEPLALFPALEKILDTEQGKQFLFIGDTDHRDFDITGFLSRPDVMATLAARGYKQLFFECPTENQRLIDELQNGVTNREDFIKELSESFSFTFQRTPETAQRAYEQVADMILLARKQGIRVYAIDADERNANSKTPLQEKVAARNLSKSDARKITEERIQERLSYDSRIGKQIQMIAGADKAIVFYGAAHQGIIDELGRKKTAFVALHKAGNPNAKQYNARTLYVDGTGVYHTTTKLTQPLLGKNL